MAVANRLKAFWNRADTLTKWKLQVFDAIIRSKLLYGLECIQLTPVEQDKLNAFQMKGIRRIFITPPTHIDRQWQNKKVWGNNRNDAGKHIFKFMDMWTKQRFRLLGHLLRATEDDPLHKVLL